MAGSNRLPHAPCSVGGGGDTIHDSLQKRGPGAGD